MGISSSKDQAEARAREIATIKAAGAAENARHSPSRVAASPRAVIANPLMPTDKGAGALGVSHTLVPPQNPDPTSVTAPILPAAGATLPSGAAAPVGATSASTPSGSEAAVAAHADSEEAENLRARSHKLTPADFILLKTIGQGSFGLVLQVRPRVAGASCFDASYVVNEDGIACIVLLSASFLIFQSISVLLGVCLGAVVSRAVMLCAPR